MPPVGHVSVQTAPGRPPHFAVDATVSSSSTAAQPCGPRARRASQATKRPFNTTVDHRNRLSLRSNAHGICVATLPGKMETRMRGVGAWTGSPFSNQFRYRTAAVDNWRRTTVEVTNERFSRIDSQMVVNRGQKIFG